MTLFPKIQIGKVRATLLSLGLEMFYHNMFDGQSFLERSRVTEAFEHFGRAFDHYREYIVCL
jgi:hypothetical protein